MEDYIIRPAEPNDSETIWQIRNYPLIRKSSGNQVEIPLEKHILWFKNKYFSGADNLCFVLLAGEKVIGYCRFDSDKENCYNISIALDYDYQGKGLGYLLLSGSLNKLETGKEVLATVKKENEVSLKLFKKNKFELVKEDKDFFYLIKKIKI